ncbi:hypothetical protein R1T43_09300 [Alteromonas sp. CI.11.F.A3]|nr:hypothetical protein [Alteromonas sp. CI.11.F.A3]WOI39200.1 hypothetical protein R1T43_09300 [Alteromonas sp. CI.11.F.A3]
MKSVTIILFSLFLGSCSMRDDYPSEWGTLLSDCSDETILVSNKGLRSSEYGDDKLSAMLVPDAQYSHLADQLRVSIVASASTISIDLLLDSEIVETLSINTSEFKGCENGGFVVARSSVVNSGGAIAKEWWEFTLYFKSDSLIVSKKKGAIGTLFFVPIAGTETQWLRFDKA